MEGAHIVPHNGCPTLLANWYAKEAARGRKLKEEWKMVMDGINIITHLSSF
jgi:hypothetical protein